MTAPLNSDQDSRPGFGCELGCDLVCRHPECALYGAGGICGLHGVYDGMRCPDCVASDEKEAGRG